MKHTIDYSIVFVSPVTDNACHALMREGDQIWLNDLDQGEVYMCSESVVAHAQTNTANVHRKVEAEDFEFSWVFEWMDDVPDDGARYDSVQSLIEELGLD